MEVKIKLRTIVISEEEIGKSFIVHTLRSAEEIASYVEESEKDDIVEKLEQAVAEEQHRK